MHRLIIEYSKQDITPQEAHNLTSQISEWLVNYEVYGCQSACDAIEFDSDVMRTQAILWLSDEKQISRLRLG